MREILDNIKLGIQMVIIGGLLLYIGTMLFMPDLTVKVFKFQPFIVVTESMEPVINVNDMVVVSEFDIDTAEVGEIITFKADIDYNGTQEVVTHYIYEIDRSGSEPIIRTHRHFEPGEEVVPDTWRITEDDVIGAYNFHVVYVGTIINFIRSPYGIAVITINIVLITAIVQINKLIAKREEEAESKGNTEVKENDALPTNS